jgi:hypothetical protein
MGDLDGSGHMLTGQENIKAEAVKHFKDLYKVHDSPSSTDQVRVACHVFKSVYGC